MEASCDKTSVSLTKSYVQYHDFVFTKFTSFNKLLTDTEPKDEDTYKV